MKIFTFLFIFFCVCTGQGFTDELEEVRELFEPVEGSYTIATCTTCIPLMKEVAGIICRANPKIKIQVVGGGSNVGVQKLNRGDAEIAVTGRQLTDMELDNLNICSIPIGTDGIAVILHPSNPIRNLPSQFIREIFTGRITNWKELLWNDSKINVYIREETSGTRFTFFKVAMKYQEFTLDSQVVNSEEEMKKIVASDPSAIGFVSIAFLDSTVRATTVNWETPTQNAALRGHYPIVRGLYLHAKETPTPFNTRFFFYLNSHFGQTHVKRHGFIPLSASSITTQRTY